MKNNSKKIITALAIMLGLTMVATTEGMAQITATGKVSSLEDKTSNLSVKNIGSLRFKVSFENPLRQKTKIYILDTNNEVLFNEYTGVDTKYVRAFDLSNLNDGKYTIVVESGSEKSKKDLIINTTTLRGVSLASL